MATTFTITDLQGYVEENAFELLSKAVLNTNLAQFIQVRAGLQGNNVDIPVFNDDFAVQADTSCAWADNGTTTLSQVRMELMHAKVQRAYCVQSLRDTFMSQMLAPGAAAGQESLPFEAVAADFFTKNLSKWNEGYLINGYSTTHDGIQDILAAAVTAGTIPAAQALDQGTWVPGTAGTGELNALVGAMAIFAAMPFEIALRDDLILVMSPADYKALVGAMVNENLYHYTGSVNEVVIPGTNIKAVPSSGATSGFKFLTSGNNIIMGTDLTSDFDEFKVWYSQDNDEVRASMKWTVGVTVIQPELCVAVNEQ
jgi:hypothetical protein